MNSASLEWLFTNASVLLWADKILITKQDFGVLHQQAYFDDEVDQECARILFDRLREEGVIELFDPGEYLNDVTLGSIAEQVLRDEARWGIDPEPPGEDGLYDHNTIHVGGNAYCAPVIQGVYGSLTLARFLRCTCVLDAQERSFVEDRFANMTDYSEVHSAGQTVFSDLYSVMLPSLLPERDFMLFCNPERGQLCANAEICGANAKANLQRLIEYVLVSREKPEIVRLAKRLDALETEVGSDELRLRRALLRDLRIEQKRLRLTYPTVRHWARLTQLASAPALLYGTQAGESLIWMSAAGVAALAEALHVSVDALQERRRWLTLLAEAVEAPRVATPSDAPPAS